MLIPIATTESWVQKKDTSLQKVIRNKKKKKKKSLIQASRNLSGSTPLVTDPISG